MLAVATALKLYPIAIGLLMVLVLPRAFAWRYAAMLAGACLLPFVLQRPEYVAGQYRLWCEYLIADARHAGSIKQAGDLFLFVRFWWGSPPEWLYRLVQLGTAGLIAVYCLRLQAAPGVALIAKPLAAILHLGCLWMTLLGPSTESSTYTLLGPTAAILLVTSASRIAECFCSRACRLRSVDLACSRGHLSGGTQIQHWGPQPAGGMLLFASIAVWNFQTNHAIPLEVSDDLTLK